MGLFSLAEEAVQAELQEFQFIQELGDLGPVGLALLEHQLMLEMFGMAKESRDTEAMGGGQSAQRHAIDQGAVNIRAGGVLADGTADRLGGGAVLFRHRFAPQG
jgi:hypothetical protein